MVEKATAQTKASKRSPVTLPAPPPRYWASIGAAMFPPLSTAMICCGVMKSAAPKPIMVTMIMKAPISTMEITTLVRADRASGTVKKRIMMWGSPAAPSAKASPREIWSTGSLSSRPLSRNRWP